MGFVAVGAVSERTTFAPVVRSTRQTLSDSSAT
jgi:hypothetical protein